MTEIKMETGSGIIPIQIFTSGGKVQSVNSFMKPYIEECYASGVEPIRVAGIDAMRVGKYLVLNGDEIKKTYPDVNYEKLEEATIKIIIDAQRDFDKQLNQKISDYVSLYDLHSQDNDGRFIFPHKISSGQVEPSCGTGTVTVGIAMAERDELGTEGEFELLFESGGDANTIGGPDLTKLHLWVENKKVKNAYISHSLIEIIATGKFWLNE